MGRNSHAVGCGREKRGRTDTGATTAGAERLVKEAGCQLGMSQRQPFLGSGRACLKFSALWKATTLTGSRDCCCKDTLKGLFYPSYPFIPFICSAITKEYGGGPPTVSYKFNFPPHVKNI